MNPSYQQIRDVFTKKGYLFFSGSFNMNLFAIRGKDRMPDTFDDTLCLVYENEDKKPVILTMDCTVDPGIPWLVSPMNSGGAAAIAPGQYRRVWQLGKFRNTDALIQIGNFRIYRDNDKNNVFDYKPGTINVSKPTDGIFLHEHFQNPDCALIVSTSSAGCVVPKCRTEHKKLIRNLRLQPLAGLGNTFTFTLFEETDFNI